MSNEGERGSGRRGNWLVWAAALLVLSELMGLAVAHFWFWPIYLQTVPAAMLTSFNRNTAHGWYLMNGALLGVAFFVWGLLGVFAGSVVSKSRERARLD